MTIQAVKVPLAGRAYEVLIGPGLLAQAGARIVGRLSRPPVRVVADEHVFQLYGSRLIDSLVLAGLNPGRPVLLPQSERAKTLAAYETAAETILASGIDRQTLLVVLGGGAAGDAGGFLAATLLRGLPFVQVPTTLLAQVDSSVGGKTALDTRAGKNLIGAVHQPQLVLADTELLGSLPPRELAAGYAEIAKIGLLGDEPFFAWLEEAAPRVLARDPAALAQAIIGAVEAKAAIVGIDEFETNGTRALLNLGHTFGHALEAEAGFGAALLHGEAVAIGIRLAADLSVRLGLLPTEAARRIERHLQAVGLPVRIPPDLNQPDRLLARMAADKKAAVGSLTFIVLDGIGRARIARGVPEAAVRAVLAAG